MEKINRSRTGREGTLKTRKQIEVWAIPRPTRYARAKEQAAKISEKQPAASVTASDGGSNPLHPADRALR